MCKPIFTNMARLGIVLSIAMFLSATARAEIIWQGPQNIAGDLDVSTLGELVKAWGAATTVNGVAFTQDAGGFDFNLPMSGDTVFGGTSQRFSSLSSSYQVLLRSANFSTNGAGMKITLSNLTAGKLYEFQAFVNDSRDASTFGLGIVNRSSVFDSGVGTPQSQPVLQPLNAGNTNIGQHIKGTFTAAASGTQIVRIFGDSLTGEKVSLINAYQLRDITAVPEPSSILLLSSAAGLGGMFMRKRLRKLIGK